MFSLHKNEGLTEAVKAYFLLIKKSEQTQVFTANLALLIPCHHLVENLLKLKISSQKVANLNSFKYEPMKWSNQWSWNPSWSFPVKQNFLAVSFGFSRFLFLVLLLYKYDRYSKKVCRNCYNVFCLFDFK